MALTKKPEPKKKEAVKYNGIQRTLVILKPDMVLRGKMGWAISKFEDRGFKVVAAKFVQATIAQLEAHYPDLGHTTSPEIKRKVFEFMQKTPILIMLLEGDNAIASVREMVGNTFPSEARAGTMRFEFGHATKHAMVSNGLHASANESEEKREEMVWFKKGEICPYESETHALCYISM